MNTQDHTPSYHTDPEVAEAISETLAPDPKAARICFNCQFYFGCQCRRHSPPWPGVAGDDTCGDFVRKS
jgi:hypothetical protein